MFWRAVLAGILMCPGALMAENICLATPAGSDPLQMAEADLTFERYREALSFLKGGLAEALRRHTTVADLKEDLAFGIQYTNSVRAIEVYTLKQRAIYEGGSAIHELCKFLEKTHWSD